MTQFAADLYDVVMDRGSSVYRTPYEFFSFTYPTYNLRELAKDVVTRLAGKSDKAVRQLELTYGGGKTHTLITLYHLVRDPATLPDIPAVPEFRQPHRHHAAASAGRRPALRQAGRREGHGGPGAGGDLRWLKHPWSVLAYQIAGAEGLAILHAEGKAEERGSAPAEPLLVDLLTIPRKEDLDAPDLIDEVLMFARGKMDLDPAWRGTAQTSSSTSPRLPPRSTALPSSPRSSRRDPRKNDALGKEIAREMDTIFRREGRGGRPAGRQGGRCRGPAAPVLQARVDP